MQTTSETRLDRPMPIAEVAKLFDCHASTLRRWPGFPRPVRIGAGAAGTRPARNVRAYYLESEIIEFINSCAAHRPANVARGSFAGGHNHQLKDENVTMEFVDDEIKDTARYAVNIKTGVHFIVHEGMFACPDENTRRWVGPPHMKYFADHDESKAFSDSILAKVRAERGPIVNVMPNLPAPAAGDGNSQKLPSKGEAARIAKERFNGVELVTNRSRRNVDAQFLAAHVAHCSGQDAQAAVNAIALSEHDQIPAAA